MGRKRKPKPQPPSREDKLSMQVAAILDAEKVTPLMLYELLLSGYLVYKQGVGLSHNQVWDAILRPFADRGRTYLSPYQMAALRERENGAEPDDFLHLAE